MCQSNQGGKKSCRTQTRVRRRRMMTFHVGYNFSMSSLGLPFLQPHYGVHDTVLEKDSAAGSEAGFEMAAQIPAPTRPRRTKFSALFTRQGCDVAPPQERKAVCTVRLCAGRLRHVGLHPSINCACRVRWNYGILDTTVAPWASTLHSRDDLQQLVVSLLDFSTEQYIHSASALDITPETRLLDLYAIF